MPTISLLHKIEKHPLPHPFSWIIIPERITKKTYRVPYISGKSLMQSQVIERIVEEVRKGNDPGMTDAELMEACEWFCTLFQNQFTAEELLEGHPSDHLRSDIFAAYMFVQNEMAKALKKFPMKPTAKAPKK
jgi:hypothetical protein